jgi:hypothetical protein
MQWEEGGLLDDAIDARLGRPTHPRHPGSKQNDDPSSNIRLVRLASALCNVPRLPKDRHSSRGSTITTAIRGRLCTCLALRRCSIFLVVSRLARFFGAHNLPSQPDCAILTILGECSMMRAMQLDLKPTGSSAAKPVTTEGFRLTYMSNPRTQGLGSHQRSLCPTPIHTSILARFLKLSLGTEPPSYTHDANPPARGVVTRERQFPQLLRA